MTDPGGGWKQPTVDGCFRKPVNSPVEVGSLSHYLRRVLQITGGDHRISEPSTVASHNVYIYNIYVDHIDLIMGQVMTFQFQLPSSFGFVEASASSASPAASVVCLFRILNHEYLKIPPPMPRPQEMRPYYEVIDLMIP